MRIAFVVLALFGCDRKNGSQPPEKKTPHRPETTPTPEPERHQPITFLRSISGHKSDIGYVAFHPDGRLMTAGWTDGVRLWNVETGEDAGWWQIEETIARLAAGPSGVLVASNYGVSQLSLDTGQSVAEWRDADGWKILAWRSDGMFLAGGSLWRRNDAKPVHRFADEIRCAAFADRAIVTGHSDGTVKLWDEELKQVRTLGQHYEPIVSLLVHSIRKQAWSATTVDIRLWGLEPGVEQGNWIASFHGMRGITIRPDGKRLAIGGQGISLVDAETGREIYRVKEEAVDQIEFSPDGKLLVTRKGRTVKLWSVNE